MGNAQDLKGLTCSETVIDSGGWHFHPCGKPAKGFLKNGKPACGIHLRAERKREEANREYDIQYTKRREFQQEVRAFGKVAHLLSLSASIDEVETRWVCVDFDELKKVLDKQ